MARPRFLILQLFFRSSRVQKKRALLTIAAIAWGTLALLLLLAGVCHWCQQTTHAQVLVIRLDVAPLHVEIREAKAGHDGFGQFPAIYGYAIVLAKVSNGLEVRGKTTHQPHQLDVALCLLFQTTP